MGWLVILLGAVLVAYLPSLMTGLGRRDTGQGWQFELALDTLRALAEARDTSRRGLSAVELTRLLEVTDLQLEPVMQTLAALDWVGRLEEVADPEASRYVLLADLPSTTLDPLIAALLLPSTPSAMVPGSSKA